MVKHALVASYINAGRLLVGLLDEARVDVSAALWMFDADASDWSLLLASPLVESGGARSVYREVALIFSANAERLDPLARDDVSVKGPKEKPFSLLRTVIRTGPKDLGSVRFSQNRIGDTLIEDALIYRMS